MISMPEATSMPEMVVKREDDPPQHPPGHTMVARHGPDGDEEMMEAQPIAIKPTPTAVAAAAVAAAAKPAPTKAT